MKICYLANGKSIHTERWCKHFAGLGHEIHLITFAPADIPGIKIHHVNAGDLSVKGGNWKVLLKKNAVKKVIKAIAPDILHAQYATSYGVVGALCGFHPYIITALGTDVLVSPKRSFVYRTLVRYALRKADWVTAMAEHMRKEIIDLGINEKKVSTVMFGIDPMIFNRVERKIDPNRFVITSTRNFEPIYNIQLLLEAFKIAREKMKDPFLNLIGDGTLRASLEKYVNENGLKDQVKFFGKIPQPQIADVLRHSDLFVSTSLSDGNNVSLNEAMACGCISLATDIPANRHWIKENMNGFLVPLHDAKYMADKILYVYKSYSALEEKAFTCNDKLIREEALWSENMKMVEKKYIELGTSE